MKNFNLLSYATGRVYKSFVANTQQEAEEQAQARGYDNYDDFFMEEAGASAPSTYDYNDEFNQDL